MPDRRKKKTREDAVRMLQQRAANSGIKNEAQQKAWESGFKGSRSNADARTATTPQTSRTTQSTNSSTTPRNSLQTSQRGSQSPSVSRRSPSLTDVANRRNLVTSERAKRTQLTTPTRRTSSINNIDDRRSGRYRNDRREQQSYVNTPRNRVQYDKGKTTIGDRVADTLKGSAKQWAGGHMSSVGTAAQFAEPTVRGIQKTEYRDPSETGYSLRSRKEAELRQNERTQNIALKEGRDLRTFKGRDYSDKNANLQAFIKSADSLIDSGSRDIERAKKGAGKLGSFAIDTMSNMAQMGGDLAMNVALPGLGMVALGMRSAGMGSYQARQQGLDVNEQALHGLIDGVVEMGSEAIFGGVSALQKTYGKGMFSLADKLGWRTASSEMVRRMFKTDFGQALATHLSRLGAGMLEEGTEELIADVFEPALKYVFTKANNPDYKFEGTDLKQMGYDFLLGAMTAGVLGGGSTVAGIRADSQAFVDGQNYAQDLVNRARVQGREGMATTNAEILGGRLQSQMERGIEASPYQIRTLQEAVGESQLANAIDYEKRNAERYQQAVDEGRANTVQQQGTYQEYEGFQRRVSDTLERNYERARSVMGEDASEESVNAVRNVITGSTDNYDIDTVLTDNEAKKAVETLTGTKLSVNNQTARNEIENIALTRQIQNRDAILQETHESIRTEMSKRGGQLFDENYDRAVETLDVPNGANIYDSFFSRFYTDGTVQGADFDKSYNRIMGSIREDFGDELAGKIGEVFNMDFAQKVFAEGQMAQATYNAKYQGKALSLKASENPAGFTYEDTARAKISDRQADLLTKFAERANIHIRLVDSIAGGSANGSYENGVIMIAADSTNKLVTVAKHELTHHIRSTSPELYQKLEDFIFNKYYEWDADALENKIREYQERGYNMTAEKIKEEIVADASEAFFTDEGSIQAVVKHDRGLAQAIHDGIKTLLDTLLDLQDSDNLGTRGYGDFLDDIDILREAEKMWLDALNDSVQKTREASTKNDSKELQSFLEENGLTKLEQNPKMSLKETEDNQGNKLTEGQREFFKDSKATDENGKLAVVYHTTNEGGFTVFDPRMSDDKRSLFFSSSYDVSQTYGDRGADKPMSFDPMSLSDAIESLEKAYGIKYLYDNIRIYKNDIDLNLAKDLGKTSRQQMQALIKGLQDGSIKNSDYRVNIELGLYSNSFMLPNQVVEKFPRRGFYATYLNFKNPLIVDANGSKWTAINYNNRTYRTRDLSAIAEKNGYDGVIIRNVEDIGGRRPIKKGASKVSDIYIAFSSNQVKAVSNENPTENEDIRYSIKEDEETTNPNVNVLDKSGKVLTTSKGDPVAKFEKNGSAQFSLKTYEDKGRSVLKNYLKKMVKAGDFSQAEADQMFNEMETIYRITRDLADTGKYAPFTAWSEADVVMGKNNKPVFSSVKANSEYKMNIDFSTICKKRRTLDAVFRTMINRGMMENLDLNKDESAALVVNINDLIRKYDFEAACALCFVEARRYRQQQTAKTFRDMWNGLVESMYKDKSKIEYFNFGEDKTIKEVPDGIHTMDNKDLDLTYVRQIATARKEDGKLMQTAEAKAAREILNHPSQRKLMRIGDMMASTGFENMQVKNPALMKIYNAKKGTGGAKSSFGDVQYLNEIINSKTFDRKKAYAVSGVRIQSFSDYVPRMVFDYVQVIADLAAKRLPAHAYTKEVLFVLQFGLTGAKINMSLVPDVVKDGIAPGLDKDGNYVWNTDGTFPWEDYKDDKGRTWPGARSIQKAKGYKENCGTIAVGISDEQIWKMLADPEIQMVIPYHKSSLNPLVAQMTNVHRFTDYTDYQNTKTRDGKNVPKEFDWDNKLFELSHGKDGKLLPKSEWGDIQDLVQEYVDWCNENDYVPKFERFLYMKDGSINPGYYKMLEDFALLDEEGNFKPQDDVKMRFPTKDSAYGDMASLIEQGLSEDTTLERKRDSKVGDIVDEIGELLKTEEGRQALTQKSMESDILSARMENEDEDVHYSLKDDSFFEDRREQKLWNESGKGYFNKATNFYSQYQEGQANKDNFFKETIATFEQVDGRPKRKPDYTSLGRRRGRIITSSEYWYTKDGVIRGSNHWGTGIASCDWALKEKTGRTIYGREGLEPIITDKVYAKAKWSDFILKTDIKGDGTLTSFENQPEEKYSLKDLDSDDQTIASQNTISKLEEQVKDLKAEFKRTNLKTANQKDVRIQAGRLIRRHDSNLGTQKSLMDTFNKIFALYKEKGTDAFDEVYEIAKDEAVNIVNNISVLHNEGSEEYKAIKEYLRTTPIEISEDMKRNITDYESFRKRNFGRLKLKNGQTSNIDNVYMELMEMFPGQFTEDYVNPADQLNHIVDVLDNYAPVYENLDGASEEMQDYVVDIAADIMETAYNLQTKKTFADKKYEEKVRAVEKAREKALASRNKALEKQKSRYEDKISALKQENRDFKSETREKAEKKRRIKQISNIYKRLNEKLQSATDTKHLPDGYAPIVSDILARFDFTTEGMEKWAARTGKTSRKMYTMNNLQSQLRALAEEGKEGGELEVDADLIPIVEDLTDILGDNEVRISDLNSEDLTKIKQLFAAFEHQLNTYNRRFVEGKNETISGSAHKAFDEMKDNKWKLGVMGKVYAPNMNPSDFFALVGGEIEELYNNTRKGFDKYVQNMDDAREFIQGIVNSKTADKWANHTNTYKTSSGDEVKLTDTQLMDLYVSSKREQAQGHIYYGGIVSAPVKITKNGKLKLVAEELEEKRVIPTQEDLVEWFKNLSKEQIKAADAMQKYLTEVPSEWGNETSMTMYNYRKFNEKNYWPIQSSADYRDSNFDMKGTDPTLKNISPSKAVVKGANNAIMIDDIFSVFCTHIAQMASYNAYVPAISDFQRVWNYSEGNNANKVKARFKAAYGKQAFNYVEDFFKSLNGTYKDNIGAGGLFDKTMGLFKKAAVGGNIRVLVQQPTAIARAALIVNPAYLTASIPSSMAQNKKVYQEMMEHCPIAKWKAWGFYSTDVSSASRDLKNIMIGKEALTDKIFMDMYGVADNVTWTVIFNACKMQVEAQNKGLKKGSDEYWEKVNDLASRVFDRTQVVDSPFHRSNLMKSTDTGKKMLTAFMAEPTKTVNMLNTELTLAMRELRAGKPGKAAGIATRVLMVFMANAAILACAQALVDAMRHTGGDDDKDKGKYGDRWVAYWKDNFKENMEIIGMIPILKDVKSISDGYDVARMDMQGIQRVVQSVQYLKKYRENPSESKYTGFEEYSNVAFAIAYSLGIPVSNVKRDLEALALTGAEATNNPDVALWFMKNKYQVNSKTKSLWINSYFNALENGNEGLANNIKKYITSNGVITDDDIQKAANKRRKDNPTEEDKARIEKSQQTLEGSNIWKTASDDDKDTYSGYLENIALGIENRNTASITNYATDGLTNEQVVLFKLALRKVDKPNKNGNLGTFDKDEKEAALKLLMQNYKFTEKQKDILLTIKS